eukprot:COSAG01_NODE_6919_length_3434_cov_3.564371_4_plen_162_part_00
MESGKSAVLRVQGGLTRRSMVSGDSGVAAPMLGVVSSWVGSDLSGEMQDKMNGTIRGAYVPVTGSHKSITTWARSVCLLCLADGASVHSCVRADKDGNPLAKTHTSFVQMWPKDRAEPGHRFPNRQPHTTKAWDRSFVHGFHGTPMAREKVVTGTSHRSLV